MSENVATGPASPGLVVGLGGLGVVWLALLFSLGGAWDTDELSLARSLAVWTIISGLLVSQPVLIDHQLGKRTRLPPFICGAVAVSATVGLMTIEIAILKMTPLPPSWWGRDSLWELAAFIWPQTALIAAGVVWLARGVFGAAAQRPMASLTPRQLRIAPPAISGLLPAPAWARMTDWPRAAVSRVQAHDHYLEVHTEDGRVLLLRGRMGDAVSRLAGADGLRVHRSWWIARRVVSHIGRFGRDYLIVLTDGTAAPVARGRLADLRRRGWISSD